MVNAPRTARRRGRTNSGHHLSEEDPENELALAERAARRQPAGAAFN